MLLALVHLSDLHFRNAGNWLTDKIDRLSSAIWSLEPSTSSYLVLISGDVAFSGRSEEYGPARMFIDALLASFAARTARPKTRVVVIPGNHDCDFKKDTDARQLLIDSIRNRLPNLDPDGEIASTCLAVQEDFNQFAQNLTGEPAPSGRARFVRVEEVIFGDFRVAIHSLNTAWMSTLEEGQGKLLYPIDCLRAELEAGKESDFAVTMLHHPYNWMAADNARELRELIERHSDLVLTGHEHVSSSYFKEGISENLLYVEGAVLQGDSHGKSGCSVLYIDTERRQQKLIASEWRSGLYSAKPDPGWRLVRKNQSRDLGTFRNTADFASQLAELGTGFTHPHSRSALSLKQMFVYPDFVRRSPASKRPINPNIDSQDFIKEIYEDRRVMVSGAPLSGRSTLAKAIYTDLQRNYDLIPVLLEGRSLSGGSIETVRLSIEAAVRQQYGPNSVERYTQLPSTRKVIIIDDFERCGLNSSNQSLMIDQLAPAFDFVVLFLDEFAALTSLAVDDEVRHVEFEVYEIREFGHYLRSKLIEKWASLGREHRISDVELNAEVERLERLVTSLLGRNLLPSNPITILAILQASDVVKGHDQNAGSYGYLYETLILHALSMGRFKPAEIDVIMTFLSLVAARMLKLDREILSSAELDFLTGEYFQLYRMRLPDELLVQLGQARLIFKRDGQYGFRYPYCYYFFTARHLRDQLHNDTVADVRKQIADMVQHIHYEPYTHILTFYIYLTKDLATIKLLLESARLIFADFEPCNFDSDVEFINRLYKGQATPKLPATTPVTRNRDDYRRQLDASDREQAENGSDKAGIDTMPETATYAADLPMPVKASMAMRLIQILGQIIRNSPGSLKAGIKAEVTAEAYALGLRFLNAFLQFQSTGYAEMHGYFVELINEYRNLHRKKELSPGELSKQADETIIRYSEAIGFAVIRRISQAIGLKELKDIYADVLELNQGSMSMQLIDLAVKLDVFDTPPLSEAKTIHKEFRQNFYSHNVFADLLKTYLYLRDVSRSARGEISSLLKINFDPKKRLLNQHRRS